jgi:phosphopantothenoylcysteine decarboxylase/phosphopantothenate--cysteine ligase
MGCALARAAIDAGHEVVVVSGPVNLDYPKPAKVVPVVSTEEMLEAAVDVFGDCDGMIGVAAPCDYRPIEVAPGKIAKNGDCLTINLAETPDIVATLATAKGHRWMVAFALETEDRHFRAMQKLERKKCDLIVLNGPEAMFSHNARVEVIDARGRILADIKGTKLEVAIGVFEVISRRLIER